MGAEPVAISQMVIGELYGWAVTGDWVGEPAAGLEQPPVVVR